MIIKYNESEQAASDCLLEFMRIVQKDWKLEVNHDEMVGAIHTLQTFIIKHMLQRLKAEGFSDWFENANI